jgi:hypothetical protein
MSTVLELTIKHDQYFIALARIERMHYVSPHKVLRLFNRKGKLTICLMGGYKLSFTVPSDSTIASNCVRIWEEYCTAAAATAAAAAKNRDNLNFT